MQTLVNIDKDSSLRIRSPRFAALCLLASFAVPLAPALAEPAAEALPRTPDGRPDFQGIWESRWRTPFNRAPSSSGPIMSAEEHATQMEAVAKRNAAPTGMTPVLDMDFTTWMPLPDGTFRTSQVVEPASGRADLTPVGEAMFDAEIAHMALPADGVELRPLSERCISGVGTAPLGQVGYRQIVQTPDHVLIQSEMHGEYRILAIGGEHRPAALRSWEGDSIARWEEDALVVETSHARPELAVRGVGFVVRPDAKVTERFQLRDADTITYSYTVEDQEIYSGPWRAEFIMIRTKDRMHETACHEANYALVHILKAAREADGRRRK